jgi:hypothetical protein
MGDGGKTTITVWNVITTGEHDNHGEDPSPYM